MGVQELLEGRTDLAIVRFEDPLPGVCSRALAKEQGILAVPSDHPVSKAGSVSFGDLREESFITLPEAVGSVVRAQFLSSCHRAGFAPDIVQTAPDSCTCVALVAAGVGLHYTTDSALRQMTFDGVRGVVVFDETPSIFSYLLWRKDDRDRVLAKVLPPRPDHPRTGRASAISTCI